MRTPDQVLEQVLYLADQIVGEVDRGDSADAGFIADQGKALAGEVLRLNRMLERGASLPAEWRAAR